jgi:hypothetical protein
MKQLVITALLALTGLGAQAQTSETRKSNDFTTLDVKNGIEVVFTQSNESSLKVEADSRNNLDNIATEFKNGTLKIYLREQANGSPVQGTAKVYVASANVTGFKIVTGASVKVSGKLTIYELTVKLASGAAFTGEAQCTKCIVRADSGSMFRGKINSETFDTKITGGASVKIIGNTDTAIVICNSGSFLAGKFVIKNADVKTSNASSAFVNATESIIANTDTTSSITYYGEPAKVNLGENSYAIKRDNLKLALNN